MTTTQSRFTVIAAEVELDLQEKVCNALIQQHLERAEIQHEGDIIVSVVLRFDNPSIHLLEYEDKIACVSIPLAPALARCLTKEGIAVSVAAMTKIILDSPHLLAEGEEEDVQPTT